MKIVFGDRESGVQVPAPHEREIKLLLGPDKYDVSEVRCNIVTIPQGGKTTVHAHDRPELIFVIAGQGVCVSQQGETVIYPESLIWAEKGDQHQIRNDQPGVLKLFTLFVPGFTSDKALYNQQLNPK